MQPFILCNMEGPQQAVGYFANTRKNHVVYICKFAKKERARDFLYFI